MEIDQYENQDLPLTTSVLVSGHVASGAAVKSPRPSSRGRRTERPIYVEQHEWPNRCPSTSQATCPFHQPVLASPVYDVYRIPPSLATSPTLWLILHLVCRPSS